MIAMQMANKDVIYLLEFTIETKQLLLRTFATINEVKFLINIK